MRRFAPLVAMASLLLVPAPALAHALIGRVESPLPLSVYLAGAAAAVALSFALVLVRDVRPPAPTVDRPLLVPRWVVYGFRVVGLTAWLWVVAQTVVGGSSLANVGTLFLWVYGWVGTALASAFIAPVWTWLNPFTTLFDMGAWMVRRLGVPRRAPRSYPARLGAWVAVAGFAFFVWVELVYQTEALGGILIAYTVLTLAGMAVFGREPWRTKGEAFSVWFATLNRLAPFGAPSGPDDRVVRRRPFAAGLFEAGWTMAHVALVAIGVASIIFDGLSQTQFWFELFGLPSLGAGTVELFAFLGIVMALALGVARLVGYAAIGAGLVPIAVGYLIAHYLTFLLLDGQRIIIVISDPLQLGWDVFDTATYDPSLAWIPPAFVWATQLAAVVGGHVVGAWAGHVLAERDAPAGVNIRLRQVPLAVLMVCLTVLTLWSLGQAIVSETASMAIPIERSATRPVDAVAGLS